jgi:hypothetical protein
LCVWLASRRTARRDAPALPEHRATNVGILFDTRALGDDEYGLGAYRLFFNLLDPVRLANCTLYDGDTTETLLGRAVQYCIRVEAERPEQIEYVRATFAACDSSVLRPASSASAGGTVVTGPHPLGVDRRAARTTLSMVRAAFITAAPGG